MKEKTRAEILQNSHGQLHYKQQEVPLEDIAQLYPYHIKIKV